MRNKPLSETALLLDIAASIRDRLPRSWSLSPVERAQVRAGDSIVDAIFELSAPDGSRALILVDIKATVDARDVPRLASQLRSARQNVPDANAVLLIAPFISCRTREVLQSESIAYADSTGNVRLELDRPSLFVETAGADENPWKEATRPLQSLKGPSTGRAVRALVDVKPPYGIRELAERTKTSAPTLSRVADLLVRDALLVRDGSRGKITEVDWNGVIRRWARDYSFADSNRARSYLEPRGLRTLLKRLTGTTVPYAITGSVAANKVSPITEPRAATIYITDLTTAAAALELRPAEAGANVILAEPYDGVVFERTRAVEGLKYVNASQLAADLLTSPGRGPSEGEAVLRWMLENKDEWRV